MVDDVSHFMGVPGETDWCLSQKSEHWKLKGVKFLRRSLLLRAGLVTPTLGTFRGLSVKQVHRIVQNIQRVLQQQHYPRRRWRLTIINQLLYHWRKGIELFSSSLHFSCSGFYGVDYMNSSSLVEAPKLQHHLMFLAGETSNLCFFP